MAMLSSERMLVVAFLYHHRSRYNVFIILSKVVYIFKRWESMAYFPYNLHSNIFLCIRGDLDELHEMCNCALSNFLQASNFSQISNHLFFSFILRLKRNFYAFYHFYVIFISSYEIKI